MIDIDLVIEQLENELPVAMLKAKRWLLRDEQKIPYYPDGSKRRGTLDSPEDVQRFGTFQEAVAAWRRNPDKWAGLGFALGKDGDGYWQAIDIDDSAVADTLMPLLYSYIERSPSGKGLHVIGYGRPFKTLAPNGTGVEAYCKGRYITVTGESQIGSGELTDIYDLVRTVIANKHGTKIEDVAPDPAAPTTNASPYRTPTQHDLDELHRAIGDILSAQEGTRNNTLYRSAVRAARHWLKRKLNWEIAREKIYTAAIRAGLSDYETNNTLKSAYSDALEEISANPPVRIANPVPGQKNGAPPAPPPETSVVQPTDPEDPDTRPIILVTPDNRHEVTRAVTSILVQQEALCMYGTTVAARRGSTLTSVDAHWLGTKISEVARFRRYRRHHGEEKPEYGMVAIQQPEWLARSVAAYAADDPNIKRVDAITNIPCLGLRGEIIQPGLNHDNRVYYCPEGEPPQIPEAPTQEEAIAAARKILHPIRLFPYASPADRGVALAAMMTAVMRPVLPTAPGFGFSAPAPGTGKTLLAQTVMSVRKLPETLSFTEAKDHAEERKRLFALLKDGESMAIIDNWPSRVPLDSPTLCSFLTAPTFKDRVLGSSLTQGVPNRMMISITGNNLPVGGDLVRRILICTLDAGVELPETRSFNEDPLTQVQESRMEIAAAVCTIIRAWIAAGRPMAPVAQIGSFPDWERLIRHPLLWLASIDPTLDIDDPVKTIERQRDRDEERDTLAQAIKAIHEATDGEWFVTRDVVQKAQSEDGSDLYEALGDIATNVKRLGRWLNANTGRIAGGLKIVRGDKDRKNAVRWRIAPVAPPTTDPPGDRTIDPGPPPTPPPQPTPKPNGATVADGLSSALADNTWGIPPAAHNSALSPIAQTTRSVSTHTPPPTGVKYWSDDIDAIVAKSAPPPPTVCGECFFCFRKHIAPICIRHNRQVALSDPACDSVKGMRGRNG